MATEILDLRRTDERNTYLHHPTWVEMAAITKEAVGKAAILMSFPSTKGQFFRVHEISCIIVTAFDGTPALNIGNHTIATEKATTGDTATVVDADAFIQDAHITKSSPNIYPPQAGTFVTQAASGIFYERPSMFRGLDTDVDCISAELSGSDITKGEARVYALISAIPGT